MSIIAIVILGSVAIGMIPVSLMPKVDIPQITIQISNPGASAAEVNNNLIQPIRNQLIQLSDLKEMKCTANNGGGTIFMQFEHGSNLGYNFIEVNEKVDRAYAYFPKNIERPKVVKANATDIPVFLLI
jgi:Cation/multidrug efflux pump